MLARRDAERALAEVIGELDETQTIRRAGDHEEFASRVSEMRALADTVRNQIDLDEMTFQSWDDRAAKLRDLLDPKDVEAMADKFGIAVSEVIDDVIIHILTGAEDINTAIATAGRETTRLATRFGLTEEAAARVVAAYQALRDAATFKEQAEAAGDLRAALVEAGAAAQDQSEEQRAALVAFLRQVAEAEDQLLQLDAAGEEVAPGLENAAEAASDLADELGRAAGAMQRLHDRAELRLERARVQLEFRDDPEELRRQLRLIHEREAVAPIEMRLRADGLSEAEIASATAALREQARAAFEAGREAEALEERLSELGRAGKAGSSGAAREVEKLRREMEKARAEARALETATRDTLAEYAGDAIDTRDEVAEAWGAGFKGLEDALTRFVTTGKASFGDLANSIIADLARISIRRTITGPLADILETLAGSLFGGSDLAPETSIRPRARPFHAGGVPRAAVPYMPALAPGEVNAVLMEGEAVLTPRQSRAVLAGQPGRPDHTRALEILREAARYHAGGVAGVPSIPGLRASDIPTLDLPRPAPVAAPPSVWPRPRPASICAAWLSGSPLRMWPAMARWARSSRRRWAAGRVPTDVHMARLCADRSRAPHPARERGRAHGV